MMLAASPRWTPGGSRPETGLPHPWRMALRSLGLSLLAFALTLHSAESSMPAPLAAGALLLDVARAGDRLVAVGDYGNVVVSTDEGRTWRQVIVPARSLLTGVSFPDAAHGWIVGHDGVILATADGGDTWRRLDDGQDLDTVFLDVLFLDTKRGFAVGAYGVFRATEDGGATWLPRKPSGDDFHFNRISAGGDRRLYLAGESGTALVSVNAGHAWTRLAVPYDGSLFGILPGEDDTLLLYGLRGHILSSPDRGRTWADAENPVAVLIMGGIRLRDGRVVLAGQGGNFFVRPKEGAVFVHRQPDPLGTGVADLIETADGAIVTVGEGGARRLQLP